MRRLIALLGLIVAFACIAQSAQPAGALPASTSQLTKLGTISSHHPITRNCLLVPEAVSAGTVTIDFQYRGPDDKIYVSEGSGSPLEGELGICPNNPVDGSAWPTGFYYLHAIVLTSNSDAMTTYFRFAKTIQYPDGTTVRDCKFDLRRDDFWLN